LITTATAAAMPLEAAYAWCESLARAHYENFPVGSRLLPRATRRDLWAIYAFARTADDWADEPDRGTSEARLARLDDWRRRVAAAHRGDTAAATAGGGAARPTFTALGETMAARALPLEPFEHLLSAFAQDVTTRRYETWADLLDYCRRSANPVGRLVLLVHGYRDAALLARSDAVCTALQLTNHWQDLALDVTGKDRLYVPRADLAAFGVPEADLVGGRVTDAYRRMMAALADRTRALYDAGRDLPRLVGRDLRLELALVWHGGRAVLERTAAAGFDVWHSRPRLGRLGVASCLVKAWLGR
jgi:phytoene synthase